MNAIGSVVMREAIHYERRGTTQRPRLANPIVGVLITIAIAYALLALIGGGPARRHVEPRYMARHVWIHLDIEASNAGLDRDPKKMSFEFVERAFRGHESNGWTYQAFSDPSGWRVEATTTKPPRWANDSWWQRILYCDFQKFYYPRIIVRAADPYNPDFDYSAAGRP